MLAGAESLARNHRHVRFRQQPFGKLQRIPDAVPCRSPPQCSDTRKTRPRGSAQFTPGMARSRCTTKSRRLRYSASIAATESCGPRSASTARLLRDRSGVRSGVALQLGHGGDNRLRAPGRSRCASPSWRRSSKAIRPPARSPSRPAATRWRTARCRTGTCSSTRRSSGRCRARDVSWKIFSNSARSTTAPLGLRGRVDDHHAGARREVRLDHRGGQGEALGFVGIDEHALAAGVVHHVLVRHPVGHRDHHFVAGIDQRLREVEDARACRPP